MAEREGRARSVAFVGSKQLGVRVLEELSALIAHPDLLAAAITIDDRDDVRTAYEQLLAAASRHDVPAKVVANRAAFDEAIEAIQPDVAIVAGWYRIIDVARHASTRFFGFHASPLPRYRGSAPLVWQILRGESEIGLSFFELTPGMDEGGVVDQRRTPLGPDESIADALRWVEESTVDMLRANLGALLDGTARLTDQDPSEASYVSARSPEDGLISWEWPARVVHDFVRAQTHPYPGAFTHLPDGAPLHVWRAAVDPREVMAVPGSVIERTADHVTIACGQGALRLLDVTGVTGPHGSPSEVLRTVQHLS